MTGSMQAGFASGPLLLADISGYTGFLQVVAQAHRDDAFAGGRVPDAYSLMSSLLDGIIERIVPPFTLSKVEGDAVFAFARVDADVPSGPALLDCLSACYESFRDQLGGAKQIWTCSCDAWTPPLRIPAHAGQLWIGLPSSN
ncbi:MAG: DUF2652 domain-containing protein [Candidatus Limnocylindrales bacterium]